MSQAEEYPFIPLYFSEDEEELWIYLVKLPPRERVKTVMKALRAYLSGQASYGADEEVVEITEKKALGFEAFAVGKHEAKGPDMADGMRGESASQNVSEEPNQELSIESLFVQAQPEVPVNPLQNLLAIIGEEEDEEVLQFLRGTGK